MGKKGSKPRFKLPKDLQACTRGYLELGRLPRGTFGASRRRSMLNGHDLMVLSSDRAVGNMEDALSADLLRKMQRSSMAEKWPENPSELTSPPDMDEAGDMKRSELILLRLLSSDVNTAL